MDIFSVLTLIGGLALFLYGMDLMGSGLKKLAGGQLEVILGKLTSTRIKGFLLGLFVTAAIQSSSATIVMVVGFVNSGIMKLAQTTGIILGANIGTTVTAWILSLTGINGSSTWINLLKPESFTPVLAVIGVLFTMFSESDKRKNVGSILIGFAILMYGMKAMSSMDDTEMFSQTLMKFSNPVMAIIIGTVLTAIIQSSSASVGILQALSLTTAIPFSLAVPIIFGQNLGAAITPILSALSGNVNAKRVAAVGLYVKLFSVIAVAIVFYILNGVFDFAFMSQNVNVVTIAIVHTAFNVISTFVILPFCRPIENLAKKTIRGKEEENDKFATLDDRFLSVPSFAVEKCKALVFDMAEITRKSVLQSTNLITAFDKNEYKEILASEGEVDRYEDKTSAYLVKISGREMNTQDSRAVTQLLHVVGDIERISDHAVNIAKAAREMDEKGIVFSDSAKNDIKIITDAVRDVLNLTIDSFIADNSDKAKKVEPLDEVIDKLRYKIKDNHIKRLRDGDCTVEMGFILSDLLSNYERVSGHCSNIALSLLNPDADIVEPHKYMHHVKEDIDNGYSKRYKEYKEKYSLKK